MSNFTPLVTKEYEFEGDNITVVFSRMKRKHMISAMPHMKALSDNQDAISSGKIPEELLLPMNELLNDVIDVMPEYIKSIDGLVDAEGKDIPIETMVDDFYFLGLATRISLDMVKESSPIDPKKG